jgi:hypothetical protein
MVEEATLEDVKSGSFESLAEDKNPALIGFEQFKSNPLSGIDTKALIQRNAVMKNEKKLTNKEFQLKKLFLSYLAHYASRWDVMQVYPKQIKQKPAWFDLALSKFKDEEISSDNRKKIKTAFNTLWEFRDRSLPERVMSEEESNRQFGINSPYYTQPEISSPSLPESTEELPQEYPQTLPQEDFSPQPSFTPMPQQSNSIEEENDFGIKKIVPSGDSLLSRYIIPARKTIGITPSPSQSTLKPPQGNFTMGITQQIKDSGGSGSGAFGIGRSMFAGLRGKDSLQGIINQRKPNLPVQPVQVTPDETITVAQQPEVMQRKSKKSVATIDRKKIGSMPKGLSKFRNIELPTIPKTKMPKISPPTKKKKTTLKISTGNGLNIKSGKINTSFKVDKDSVGNMSRDVRKSVGGVVGGIKNLKKQVRGEFKGGKSLKAINLKNIKSQKFKDHKDMNVLNELKRQTRSQLSHEALECKMVPKLKAQCDKVFTKNNITSEVKKFREEFKDINKMVPTVKGEKAKLNEVSMLGRSINHGVDGVHVNDIRDMYQKSGTTKQMNIGRMEYDYSFITGKKRPKLPAITDDVYEEEY